MIKTTTDGRSISLLTMRQLRMLSFANSTLMVVNLTGETALPREAAAQYESAPLATYFHENGITLITSTLVLDGCYTLWGLPTGVFTRQERCAPLYVESVLPGEET